MGFFFMFGGFYPDEDDQLGDEEPTDDIAEDEEYDIAKYEEVDEGISGDVSNYNEKDVKYVDFLGVKDILNYPTNDVDEFYTDGESYMFIREVTTDPFLSIFVAHRREKEQDIYNKSEKLPICVLGFHDKHRSMPMMRSVTFIVGCCFVLVLRMGEWNELTGHPKDRGKDRLNSRTNSLQQGENDVDYIAINLFYFLNRLYVVILLGLGFWEFLFCYLIRFRVIGVFMSYFIRFRF